MSHSTDEVNAAVLEYLKAPDFKYSITHAPEFDIQHELKDRRIGWILKMGGHAAKQSASFEYFEGVGHIPNYQSVPFCDKFDVVELAICSGFYRKANELERRRLPAPPLASILRCLLSDAQAGETTLADFVDDYGYNDGSIPITKVLAIHAACVKTATDLKTIFTDAQMEHLRELLTDY